MTLTQWAEVAGIVGGIIAVGGLGSAAWRRWRARENATPKPPKPLDIELVAVHFEIFAEQAPPVPRIIVTLRAVNYLNKSVQLRRVRVRSLSISGTTLHEIESPDTYDLHPRASRSVDCRRNLSDAEVTLLRSVGPFDQLREGAAQLEAYGVVGRRKAEVRFTHVKLKKITGVIRG